VTFVAETADRCRPEISSAQMFPPASALLDMYKRFQDREGCNVKWTFNETVFIFKKHKLQIIVYFSM